MPRANRLLGLAIVLFNVSADSQFGFLGKAHDLTATNLSYPHDLMTCMGRAVMKTECMAQDDYLAVATSVRGIYNGLPSTCEGLDCPQGDFAGCVLRMAGHDFMDYNPSGQKGQGGSDGCINFEDPDNKGLKPCLYEGEFGASLHSAYEKHCTTVSLADFLVIAAEEIMRITRPTTATPLDFKSQFKFGRKTSKECGWNIALPNPEHSCKAVNESFVDRMGLSWRHSAALMGVHTLGRAQAKNSGYDGFWGSVKHSRKFDNNYFASMVVKGWMPRKKLNKKTRGFDNFEDAETMTKVQWARSDAAGKNADQPEMMLNTDLCLMYSNGDGEPVSAKRDNCCTWAPNNKYPQNIFGPSGIKKFQEIMSNVDDKGYCGMQNFNMNSPPNKLHQQCCGGRTAENCGICQSDKLDPHDIEVGEKVKVVTFRRVPVIKGTKSLRLPRLKNFVAAKTPDGGVDMFDPETLQFEGKMSARTFTKSGMIRFQPGEAPWSPGLKPAKCQELPRQMQGPAEKDVVEFAFDDKVWIKEFLVAWHKATGNGQQGLQDLKSDASQCPRS